MPEPGTRPVPGRQRLAGHRGHRRASPSSWTGTPPTGSSSSLTEHTRVDDYDGLLAALDRLRRRGIRIAVDDTGAGYAGLQHLLRIRPHMLKLDTALTHGIDHDPVRSLAAALVTFALETGATIIAEGIETPGGSTRSSGSGSRGAGLPPARPAEMPPGLRLPTLAARSARA